MNGTQTKHPASLPTPNRTYKLQVRRSSGDDDDGAAGSALYNSCQLDRCWKANASAPPKRRDGELSWLSSRGTGNGKFKCPWAKEKRGCGIVPSEVGEYVEYCFQNDYGHGYDYDYIRLSSAPRPSPLLTPECCAPPPKVHFPHPKHSGYSTLLYSGVYACILHCIGIDIDIDDIDIISKPLRAPPPLSPSLYICDVCSRCSTRLGSLAWLPYRNYVRTPPRPPPPPPPLPSRGGVSRYNSGAGEPGERARRAADDDDRHQTSLISHLLGKQAPGEGGVEGRG
ncbi:hypothetical protein BZA05DRAFT_419535 [Tricharina praecox]|uniref:uncharacterized protein n=1 Tax=Tricharina praecox TaxID=43433 RepID=UPI002220F5E7|nr:uncharacterized protein BZA05DRAFT_419535 [Tricharina praecox]KAI5849710.1 hypothetical protein BZA05DRAFT_419535 [Tricharina praecox]